MEEHQCRFRANPMPDFSKIKGLPAKVTRPLTEPESPAVRKHYHLNTNRDREGVARHHVIKANPMPNFRKVFTPQYPQRHVVSDPFSFEERERSKTRPLVESDKMPVFKAQLLPSSTFQPSFVPTLETYVTDPEPFTLQTEIRGEQHVQKWKEQIEEQFEREKKNAEFKAREVPALLHTKPLSPQKSTKPPTCAENIILHSKVRSVQRDQYEAEKQKRANILEAEILERKALRDAEEAKEIASLRKTLVHKANPIHHYTPVTIKPSDKPVTQPMSPPLAKK